MHLENGDYSVEMDVCWGARGEDGEGGAWMEPWATVLIAPGTWWSCLCWKEMGVKRKHLEFIHVLPNVEF